MGVGWIVFIGFSMLYGAIAVLMTIFISPYAAGGGMAELMGYLNGINYHNFISLPALFVKIFALCFAVASGLCIGKEGPLAHIGAIVGPLVFYTPGLRTFML